MTERNEAEARLLAAKQAAEASAASLRESEERYALVTQATRDGIFDSNLETGTCYHSPRFNEILGYREDELPTGQSSFFEHVHPEDRTRLVENAARSEVDKTVQSFEHEVRVRCKDGSYRWVASNGRLLRDAAGKTVRVVGAIRDITQRREAEEKLAASEKRLRDTLDSLYGFVGLYTLDGVLLDINRAPLAAAGLKAEDVLGKPIWETPWMMHSAEERERLRGIIARAAVGEVVHEESSARIEGGQEITVDCHLRTAARPARRHYQRHRLRRRYHRPQRSGIEIGPGQAGRRGRQPRQERIPGQHEPRNPHAHERHHRLDGSGSRIGSESRAARIPRLGQEFRVLAHADHQRHPGYL